MNVLASKRTVGNKLEDKGRPLGKVGIVIVCGFVGLVFATALLGAKAATDSLIQIRSTGSNRLSATGDFETGLQVDWSWFETTSESADRGFNNSDVLAQECADIDAAPGDAVETPISDSGSGQSAALDSDSAGKLYCFAAAHGDRVEYGGYIVGPQDVID